jgi:hypothetical protein
MTDLATLAASLAQARARIAELEKALREAHVCLSTVRSDLLTGEEFLAVHQIERVIKVARAALDGEKGEKK